MHHFVVPPGSIDSGRVVFTPEQSRQIARVLRLRDGEEVVALDGQGAQYRVRVRLDRQSVIGEIIGPATDCHEPRLHVTLLAAPPKGERWEWLLQKGTEIGVARFVPLVARYSQPGTATVKPRHYEIVREATEQCRRLIVPEIAAPQPFATALREAAAAPDAVSVLLWEGTGTPSLSATLRPARQQGSAYVNLIVGPEGGFHDDEVALARERGVAIAGLGPLILRSETAGLVAAAIALSCDDGPA